MTADELLLHACIFSGGPLDFPQKWRRAARIRARMPAIAEHDLHVAVVCDELEIVRRLLREDPSLVTAKAGPQQWEPLLFLCYGRMPGASERAVEIATLLLDAGADPKTAFVHPEGGLRFSALCGVMGRGEMGAPEHPHADALAELLLDRGADPNESQGLYNTHLTYVGDDTKWLELLFRHGLRAGAPSNWSDAPDAEEEEPILDYLVVAAAANGHERRLRCLLDHGASPDARSRYNQQSSYQNALIAGRPDLARLLVERGARAEPLEGPCAFVAACAVGDRAEAERLLAGHPEFLDAVDPLVAAARTGRTEVVKLLLALGMDPTRAGRHGNRALNDASQDRAMCELLLAHGADPRARAFGGTAQNWARLAGDLEMARWHASRSRLLLDAVASGHVTLAKELVREDPSSVADKTPDGSTVLHVLPADLDQAAELIALLLPLGAEAAAVDEGGKTATERLIANGLDEVADLLAARLVDGPRRRDDR